MHGPEHEIVPTAGVTDEKCIPDTPPMDSIGADGMRDEIVVWQDEVEEVIQAVVIEDVDVADCFSAAVSFGVHERYERGGRGLCPERRGSEVCVQGRDSEWLIAHGR